MARSIVLTCVLILAGPVTVGVSETQPPGGSTEAELTNEFKAVKAQHFQAMMEWRQTVKDVGSPWRIVETDLAIFLYNQKTGVVYRYYQGNNEGGLRAGFQQLPMNTRDHEITAPSFY